ncbi:hypothetical protein GCM10010435_83120 [Winogradskya consettensis]|uniref:Uncharacterized protein n=1 Tax=Winogradskya consettensis TaxID=113560 RepID=A0A919T389_9ACTN|nr:hypothetical protein [Actinoplanes consettensis]GIM83325.1 hypothetical protein Aco04nite_85990 [Actinoplanes consettensis]
MGASGWDYYVPYQEDLNAALDALRDKVFAAGDYWWAVPGEYGKSAADYPNRPTTWDDLFDDEEVQESGTHSILDVFKVIEPGENPEFGTVEPVSPAEALAHVGTEHPTREHAKALTELAERRWHGRCAVLHENGKPTEIYFFGSSGD